MKIKATKNNVVIRIDLHQKEKHKFSSGLEIELIKGFEYNLREENPNVGVVLDAENIPTGSLVLIHHNAIQDSYKIFELDDVFSIPTDLVFLYNFNNEGWTPNEGFVISSRIFKPYTGFLVGIEPELVKNRMFVIKGIHANEVVVTTPNCDYEIVYVIEGVENRIIRTREREIIGTDILKTKEVHEGKLLIGINSKDAKRLNELNN